MHFFRDGPGMRIDETDAVVNIKIIRNFGSELKLKFVVNLTLFIVEIDIQIVGYRQSIMLHDLTQHMPGDAVVLPISISEAINENFQIYLLEKTRCAGFCSIAFA